MKPYIPDSKEYLFPKLTNILSIKSKKIYWNEWYWIFGDKWYSLDLLGKEYSLEFGFLFWIDLVKEYSLDSGM